MKIRDYLSRQISFDSILPKRLREVAVGLGDNAYYIAFTLYTVCVCIGWMSVSSMPLLEHIVAALQVVALLLLLTKCLVQEYKIGHLVLFTSLFIFLLLESRVSSSYLFIWLYVFTVSAQNIRLEKLALISFFTVFAMFLMTVGSETIGLADNIQLTRSDGSIRSSLGYAHPNGFGLFLLSLVCSWLTIRYTVLKKCDLLIPLIVALLINFVSGSRTTVVAVIIAALSFYLARLMQMGKNRRVFPLALILLVVVAAVTSLFLMINYDSDNEVLAAINHLLSDRIFLANHFCDELGINLFGTNTDLVEKFVFWGTPTGYLVDNSYCSTLLRFGVAVFTISMFAALLSIGGMAVKQEWDGRVLSGIAVYAVVGIMENVFFETSLNYYLIFTIFPLLYGYDAVQPSEINEPTRSECDHF